MASSWRIGQHPSRSIRPATNLAREGAASIEEIAVMNKTMGDLPCPLPPFQTMS
jgi:hypothetical protein